MLSDEELDDMRAFFVWKENFIFDHEADEDIPALLDTIAVYKEALWREITANDKLYMDKHTDEELKEDMEELLKRTEEEYSNQHQHDMANDGLDRVKCNVAHWDRVDLIAEVRRLRELQKNLIADHNDTIDELVQLREENKELRHQLKLREVNIFSYPEETKYRIHKNIT